MKTADPQPTPALDLVYEQSARSVGLFASDDTATQTLSCLLRELGVAPKRVGTLVQLARDPAILRQFDSLVVHFSEKDKLAETVANEINARLKAEAGFFCLVFVPGHLLEAAWRVFASPRAHIVVDPSESDFLSGLIQLYHCHSAAPSRVRSKEADDQDASANAIRRSLIELSAKMDRLSALVAKAGDPSADRHGGSSAFRFESPGQDFRGADERELMRRPRPPLPDPRLIQRIIRQRRLRARYFESEIFADPAWDILLDLTAARAEHRRVSVTSLCIAAAVPATTALRWISQMTDMGILVREQDEEDKRRAFIALSDGAADAMARYFDELGKDSARLI